MYLTQIYHEICLYVFIRSIYHIYIIHIDNNVVFYYSEPHLCSDGRLKSGEEKIQPKIPELFRILNWQRGARKGGGHGQR